MQHILVCMACYLYTVRVKAGLLYLLATAIILARAIVSSPFLQILSFLPLDPAAVTNCAALMLFCIYIIVHVFYSVEVAKLFR